MKPPIPKRVLIHSCVLRKAAGKDAWGAKTRTEISLSSVRFEPVSQRSWSLTAALPEVKGRLYYDCVNSAPAGVAFEPGDTVELGAREYLIESVEELYDDSRLHHLEVLLK